MNISDEDKKKYMKGSYVLLNSGIFVEGKSNKLFYSKFREIKLPIVTPLDMQCGANNCSNIVKIIRDNPNSKFYGVIDGDFVRDHVLIERIFILNYYSLENLVLLNHNKFSKIKEELENFIIKKGIEYCRLKLFDITFDREKYEYTIQELNNIQEQHYDIISKRVNTPSDYLKYISVKKLVESFDTYLSIRRDIKHKKRKYFEELYDELSDRSFKALFSEIQHNNIDSIIST